MFLIQPLLLQIFRNIPKPASVFDDDSDDDLFSTKKSFNSNKKPVSKNTGSMFEDTVSSVSTSSKLTAPLSKDKSEPSKVKPQDPVPTSVTVKPPQKKVPKSIFDDSDSDNDLFSSAGLVTSKTEKEKSKSAEPKSFKSKPKGKSSFKNLSIFGNDSDDDNDIFTTRNRNVPRKQEAETIPSSSTEKPQDIQANTHVGDNAIETDSIQGEEHGTTTNTDEAKHDNTSELSSETSPLPLTSTDSDTDCSAKVRIPETDGFNDLSISNPPELLTSIAKVSLFFWFLCLP